jgi:hypothetical protein
VSREEHERVRAEIEALRREVEVLRQEGTGAPPPPGAEPGAEPAPGSARARGVTGPDRLPAQYGGVYDKPFLLRVTPQVYVGGYFDVEFRDAQNQSHDFRFHRFVPFFYADIHERVKFASEVEIEDGSDVAIEFAFIDLLMVDAANLRLGVILDPLGKFNLIHDSPINDLTDRPLVNEFVLPTTLREIGAGLFGTLTPPDSQVEVKYEAYVVTGFKGLASDGATAFSETNGIKNGRPHRDVLGTSQFDDINNSFAGVGRLSLSPWLGTELGVSSYYGTYDEESDNDLTIVAVDGLVTVPQFEVLDLPVGPIELLGELGYDFIERDSFARSSEVPGDIWGYYTQANYHFMPELLTRNLGAVFFPGSTFTLVGRWDQIDIDGARRRRFTLGLNYRPVEPTVIKFDYQWNTASGDAPDSGKDDAFLISIASYF